jgi:hypothetical protein
MIIDNKNTESSCCILKDSLGVNLRAWYYLSKVVKHLKGRGGDGGGSKECGRGGEGTEKQEYTP